MRDDTSSSDEDEDDYENEEMGWFLDEVVTHPDTNITADHQHSSKHAARAVSTVDGHAAAGTSSAQPLQETGHPGALASAPPPCAAVPTTHLLSGATGSHPTSTASHARGTGPAHVPSDGATATPRVTATNTHTGHAGVGHRLAVGLKAGMDKVDRAHVNAVIKEVSEGSAFWKNEQRKEERTAERVTHMLAKQAEVEATGALRSPSVLRAVDAAEAQFEGTRDLSRCIVHIDMDSFYAAVEERDNPALRGKPMAVGGIGMLSTSNYEARRYGVRAAMPGYIAKRLCPELVIVKSNFPAYREASKQVRQVLERWDPDVRQVGMDEAYLDMTRHAFPPRTATTGTPGDTPHSAGDHATSAATSDGAARPPVDPSPHDETYRPGAWGMPANLARVEAAIETMRAEISAATGGLTASAGIAPNRMLAKIASDQRKPNGQFVVRPTRDEVLAFIQPLSVRKVGGIGKVTASILEQLGVSECAHLYHKRHLLYVLFSRKSFDFFLRSSLGIASANSGASAFAEASEVGRKSISTERTFRAISDPDKLREKCIALCQSLAEDTQKHALEGRNVGLKLKTVDFTLLSRATTLPDYVSTATQLETAALAILDKEIKAAGTLNLRLMGVRLSALRPTNRKASAVGALERFLQAQSTKQTPSDGGQGGAGGGHASASDSWCVSGPAVGTEHAAAAAAAQAAAGVGGPSAGCATGDTVAMRCPVCNAVLPPDCDANTHLDNCLSQRTIREIFHSAPSPSTSRSRTLAAVNDTSMSDRPAKKPKKRTGPLDAFVKRPS
eukprot:m.33613 g.33613  ORF g.33613 m.33613 type:complete len:786 (+) comp5035_c0_seq2:97-2454(+)